MLIGEGYNFFVLKTNNSFVVKFTQEHNKSSANLSKIESMIMFVTRIIDTFNERHVNKIKRYTRIVQTNIFE